MKVEEIHKKINKVDAVVSDFPYGKSTTTNGEELISLYKRAFINIYKILKEEGKAVIGLSNKEMLEMGKKYLLLENIYEIKVHNSLTRYISIFSKNI